MTGACARHPEAAQTARDLRGDGRARTPAELEALLKASPSRAADSGLPVPVLNVGMEMRKQ